MKCHITARLAGALLIAGMVISGCSVAVAGKPVPRPAPSGGPLLAAPHLESLLLNDEQISKIIGAPGLATYQTYVKMDDDRAAEYTIGDPACAAELWNTLEPSYRGSGSVAVAGRKVSEPGDRPDHDVDQGVVLFKTADQAQRQLDRSMVTWQRCAGRRLRYLLEGHQPQTWSVGIPTDIGTSIVVRNSEEAGDGYACQHVMHAAGNVVIDAWACGRDIADQVTSMVNDIAAKVH